SYGGTLSGTLTADVSFTVNCVGGYLGGGAFTLSTFTIAANAASVTTVAVRFRRLRMPAM
ncbi:MAG: hypothetical protein IPG24_11855, partial [Leptospiraceae bacterium]|nr:hypothetical protein [Leptospiraceae bacterium]